MVVYHLQRFTIQRNLPEILEGFLSQKDTVRNIYFLICTASELITYRYLFIFTSFEDHQVQQVSADIHAHFAWSKVLGKSIFRIQISSGSQQKLSHFALYIVNWIFKVNLDECKKKKQDIGKAGLWFTTVFESYLI